ncbi:MAG: hypothetical protein WDM92_16655 [Caulobacteraceae bacterium]
MNRWPHNAPGPGAKAARPVARAPADPAAAWRALANAVRAFEARRGFGPGAGQAVVAAAAATASMAFPVEGRDAEAAARALRQVAATLPLASANDARAGWHMAAARALAEQVEALLDQSRNAFARRITGERGDD